jgi:DNA primase
MEFDRQKLTQLQATATRYNATIRDETVDYLASRGITGETIDRFLLGTCDDIYDGWLSIPYLRPSGVIWINHRNLGEITATRPKYKASGKKHIFNTADLDIADQTGKIAIAEGEIDTITASALCGVPTVGIPGATQWTGNPHWHELFRGYQRVWVLADPDEAGLGLASAIIDTLPAARLVKLPGDVNETYMKHGDIKGFMQ